MEAYFVKLLVIQVEKIALVPMIVPPDYDNEAIIRECVLEHMPGAKWRKWEQTLAINTVPDNGRDSMGMGWAVLRAYYEDSPDRLPGWLQEAIDERQKIRVTAN